jgi:hypothetical protein
MPERALRPGLPGTYSATVLPMKDGLPKFRDFPKEFGGSGELLPD